MRHLLLFLLTAHVCGQGPVLIDLTVPRDCPEVACTIEYPLPEIAPNAYRLLCGNCFPGYGTWDVVSRLFSDWPEQPCYGYPLAQ